MNTYAAELQDNEVVRVIVGHAEWATENLGGQWVESATKVGIGWTWHGDHFRTPQPYPSWIWDNDWQPPIPYPDDDGMWTWDEQQQAWILLEQLAEPDGL